MSDFFSVYLYFALVILVTVSILGLSSLFQKGENSTAKSMPYESGIQTETHLQRERFSLHHYLVALIFLVFDIEIIFMYPWAVVAKRLGPFAFYEMSFFLIVLTVGYLYVWKKGGLHWE